MKINKDKIIQSIETLEVALSAINHARDIIGKDYIGTIVLIENTIKTLKSEV